MKKFLLYVRQYLLIILGAVSYGIGTTCFIQAAKIATGGFTPTACSAAIIARTVGA